MIWYQLPRALWKVQNCACEDSTLARFVEPEGFRVTTDPWLAPATPFVSKVSRITACWCGWLGWLPNQNAQRWASDLSGLAELRIDVNDDLAVSAEDMLEGALIANVHRVDVPPLDQAKAIQELLSKHGSQEKVAKRLGKSGAWVSQRLALLGLSEELQEKVEAGELTVKDGRRIGRLPSDQQQTEAAAALNRVKAPRKRRAKDASDSVKDQPASPIPPQHSGTATVADPAPEGLNPVKGEPEPAAGPDLPWQDPTWFNEQLRVHMSTEHREELVLLLMADG